MQGGGAMMAGNMRDLWMPLLCLVLLFISFIYGLVCLIRMWPAAAVTCPVQ